MIFKGIEFKEPTEPPVKSELLPKPSYNVEIEYRKGQYRVFVDGELFRDWESV